MIAPPYDVVDSDDVRALLARSPYNIAHIESCPGAGDTRYERAAALLRRWRAEGVLLRDESPAYYVYEQRFTAGGAARTRRCFFARLRLHAPEEGVVRPHEATLPGPREERLKLLRATATNVSPILASFRDAEGAARGVLDAVSRATPLFEATVDRGDVHRLWAVRDAAQIEALTAAVAASPVTIADGHHRYATALEHARDQRRESAQWLLAGLVAEDDPGLLILPNHRLVRVDGSASDLTQTLSRLYQVEDITPSSWDGTAVQRLWGRVQANARGPTTFGAIGIEEQRLHVLTARSPRAIDEAMPPHWSAASRSVDVLILTETILRPLLGVDDHALAADHRVGYTPDAEEAWRLTESGQYRLAFLVNPVRVEQVTAIADAGELMPQKSTFYYPKLAAGMVLNPLD